MVHRVVFDGLGSDWYEVGILLEALVVVVKGIGGGGNGSVLTCSK